MDLIIENYLKKIISRAKGTARSVKIVSRSIGFGTDQILKSDLIGYSGELAQTGVLAKRGLSRVLITTTSDTSQVLFFVTPKNSTNYIYQASEDDLSNVPGLLIRLVKGL